MAITFTWSIRDMHRVADTGAVYKVDWSCSGVDADTSTSHSRSGTYRHMSSVDVPALTEDIPEIKKVRGIGSGDETTTIVYPAHTEVIKEAHTKLAPAIPDHTASGFTAYADLTEADVLAWCKADGVGAKTEASITSNITNKIAAQVNSTGMPWAAE
jgi:hypothetical protein